jgi:hypothetical protein
LPPHTVDHEASALTRLEAALKSEVRNEGSLTLFLGREEEGAAF